MIINILLIILTAGTVQHFLYDALGEPKLLAPFLPVSESVWEHFKMIFYPLMAAIIYIGTFVGAMRDTVLLACFVAALHSLLTMTGLFYIYFSGLSINRSILPFDIAIFFISMTSGYFIGLKMLTVAPPAAVGMVAAIGLAAMLLAIVIFSYRPPNRAMFKG